MIKLGLLGASGRMGQQVARLLEVDSYKNKKKIVLAASVSKGDDLKPLLETDVVIDFSAPGAMSALARLALAKKIQGAALPAFVIGSTGWRIDDRHEIEALAEKAAIIMSSNFSTGVLALLEILKMAAPLLDKLKYTPVLVETHHRHKKDVPSGTAISLQRALAPAGPGNIQTHSVRAGEVIGDHEVTFYGAADNLTFGHYAQDRSIFARGALEVAMWLVEHSQKNGQPSRILDIQDYFNERFLK